MSESTNSYRWLPWAVVVAFAGLIIILVAYYDPKFSWYFGFLFPWESAVAVHTMGAIHEFQSGSPDLSAYWNFRVGALAGLIVLFVIVPSLWMFSELKNEKARSEKDRDPFKRSILWYVSTLLVIFVLLYATVGPVKKAIIFDNTWSGAAKNRNMDQLRSQLYTLAFDAAELYYLNYNEKGWNGFRNIEGQDGQANPITLSDLPSYENSPQNEYMMAPVESDSVITIYGVGHWEGGNSDFQNANGERGMLQLAVRVDPENNIFEFLDNQRNSPWN